MKRQWLLAVASTVAVAACGSDAPPETEADLMPVEAAPSDSVPSDAKPATTGPVVEPTATEPMVEVQSGTFGSTIERAQPDPTAPVDELVRGFNDTGFELLRDNAGTDNFVFSPTSIAHTLLMARGAADDSTAAAITDGFSIPEGLPAHAAWNAIDAQFAAWPTLALANRVWPRIGIEPDQEWIDLLASQHGTDVEVLDFAAQPDASRDTINEWVSEQTETLIPELLPPGFVKENNTLVLTDAVYFEADWNRPFGKYGTDTRMFTRLDGAQESIELMVELELADRRGAGDGFVGAEIPYEDDVFSMLVIVPDEGRFDEVRGRLDQSMLDEIDATFTTGPYELLIPKWETEATLDLLPILDEMGAAPGAYPGITPGSELSGAIHAATISVDEMGTVASASTALGFEDSGPPEPELTVAADKPFLYLIRHRATGLVLFAGQFTTP